MLIMVLQVRRHSERVSRPSSFLQIVAYILQGHSSCTERSLVPADSGGAIQNRTKEAGVLSIKAMPQTFLEGSRVQDLPLDLLARVLQHVEQADRLKYCAAVSRRWQQAAGLATSTVEFDADLNKGDCTELAWNTLSTWLCSNSYAGSVESIQVVGRCECWRTVMPALQLPFPRLRQLGALKLPPCRLKAASVHDIAASAATESSSALQQQSLGALTALSRLELEETCLDLSGLINCTALQHLDLSHVGHITASSPVAERAAAALSADQSTESEFSSVQCFWPNQLTTDALPALTQLTHLGIGYYESRKSYTDEEQQQANITVNLSSLQNLHFLALMLNKSHIIDLADLPVSLTHLMVFQPPVLSLDMMHHLMQLTQLQQLSLYSASEFPPLLLSRMTQLTGLAILWCKNLSAASISELLQAVRHLRQLRELDLVNSLHAHTSSPELYAALTASDQLTLLSVTESCFPVEANTHVFSAQHQLRSLKVLAASTDLFACPGSFERVATCCPGLQQLEVNNDSQIDQGDLDLQGMSELTCLLALTDLTLYGLHLTDEVLRSVAACTRLKDLLLDIDPLEEVTVSLAGLMQLTQLTGLTTLSLCADMADNVLETELISEGSPPDVFLQLQQALASYGQ